MVLNIENRLETDGFLFIVDKAVLSYILTF